MKNRFFADSTVGVIALPVFSKNFRYFQVCEGGSSLILARVAQMREERFSDFAGRYAKAVLAKYF